MEVEVEDKVDDVALSLASLSLKDFNWALDG
jgi:hypothetical protein